MATVVILESVEDHPNADRLSLNKFRTVIDNVLVEGTMIVISNKLEDGSHRYNIGEMVVFCSEGEKIPEHLLKDGYWDHEKNKGYLSGDNGDIVSMRKMRGILSQGLILPICEKVFDGDVFSHYVVRNGDKWMMVDLGSNVNGVLGINE